jgi:hypothetical protein
MPWVVKRRWWILAGGLGLVLLGIEPPDPGAWDWRTIAGGVGIVLVLFGLLGVVFAIPMALRARRAEHRSPRSS